MGRIRSIKPEMPQSQSFGRLSRDARLLFIELWTVCDDHGRCRAALPLLAGTLFPYDDDARGLIGGWMNELVREDMVVVYNVAGCDYLQIVNWAKHQRVDNAGKSNIPPPPAESRGDSPRTAANVGEPPRLAAGLEGKGREIESPPAAGVPVENFQQEQQQPEPKGRAVPRPESVPEQTWADWIATRKAKRAGPVTATVLAAVEKEATAAGLTLDAAIAVAAARGWQTFRAEWHKPATAGGTVPPRLVAMSREHIPNMPLGSASCQCQGCVEHRAKRA